MKIIFFDVSLRKSDVESIFKILRKQEFSLLIVTACVFYAPCVGNFLLGLQFKFLCPFMCLHFRRTVPTRKSFDLEMSILVNCKDLNIRFLYITAKRFVYAPYRAS